MFGAIGTIAAIGGSLGSAYMQAEAARDAAETQAGATRAGIGEQGRQFDIVRSDQAPYRRMGDSAVMQLLREMGISRGPSTRYTGATPLSRDEFDPESYLAAYADINQTGERGNAEWRADPYKHYLLEGQTGGSYRPAFRYGETRTTDAPLSRRFSIEDFWQDPVTQLGYESGLEEGRRALKNMAPLTFGSDSGAAIKAMTKFGQDYAGQRAAESQNRFEGNKSNVFNRLMAMIGGGQVANQVNAAAGANMANNVAGMTTAMGNANAASRIGQANAWTGALGNLSNWWQQQQNRNMQQQMLDRAFPRATGYNPNPNYSGQNLSQPDFREGFY